MTNWCQNRLEVSGPTPLLGAWRAAQQGASPGQVGGRSQALSFHAQLPAPPDAPGPHRARRSSDETQRLGLLLTGHADPTPDLPLDSVSWRILHWGCSGDAAHVNLTSLPERLTLEFLTPWGPPLAWLQAVATAWPALGFELRGIEPGNELYVHVRILNGRVQHSEERAPTRQELLEWGYEPDDA